jgi:hypothetical protein
MHSVWNVLPSLLFGALVASCAGSNPVATIKDMTAGDPAAPYLGMSRSEVIACAGQPHSQYRSGDNAETLTYRYSGEGPRPGADKKWTCTANLLFDNARLARVSFAHRDARSPYAHLSEKDLEKAAKMKAEGSPTCVFTLPNCRR